MRFLVSYDLVETARVTGQWMGATAQALGSYPTFAMVPSPGLGRGDRTHLRPDDGKTRLGHSHLVTCEDGKDHLVTVQTVVERPFGDLIHFRVLGRKPAKRRVLLVAPMSGHYATLLRRP
jgi:poly(3-hydroxybutyrate) depolymerase